MDYFFTQINQIVPAPLLYVLVMLYIVTGGVRLDMRIKVGLVYFFSLLLLLQFGLLVMLLGSLTTLFLLLEVFCEDEKRLTLFRIHHKIVDFLYRIFIEHYYVLYLAAAVTVFLLNNITLHQFEPLNNLPDFTLSITVISACILLLLLAKGKYSTYSITEIIEKLERKKPVDIDISDERKIKYDILLSTEDVGYFGRKDMQHRLSVRDFVKKTKGQNFCIMCKRRLRKQFCRGHSTIEMQLVRTIGVKSGYESCKRRRKVFEYIFSNILFNSYAEQFSEGGASKRNLRHWILENYLLYAPVRFGERFIYPDEEKSSFEIAFGKSVDEASNEEFFVWVLGLKWFKLGVGKNAVEIYAKTVDDFELDREKIMQAIVAVNEM